MGTLNVKASIAIFSVSSRYKWWSDSSRCVSAFYKFSRVTVGIHNYVSIGGLQAFYKFSRATVGIHNYVTK